VSLREALVTLGAISRNVETIRAATTAAQTMVVVKANAYGHGAVPAARAALEGGADWLGVVDLDEAFELRDAGISAPLLAWLYGAEADYAEAIARDVDIGVHNLEQLERVAATSNQAKIHIKVDTGLGRNGASVDDCDELFAAAARFEKQGALRVTGLFSHLANIEDEAQVERFERLLAAARAAGLDPEFTHIAATGGALSLSNNFSLQRIGIGAYGLSPYDGPAGIPLEPAMQLSGEIVSVKRVPAGSGVSYGHTYITQRETTLALVPIGYADGVPRAASNRGPVTINGQRFMVAGRVAMDQFVVDIGDAAVKTGDRAVLFGDPATGVPSAQDWATAADTINYEIVARIGARVTRRYVP